MANIFQNVLLKKLRKSVFDLSYENTLSFDMGQLIPIYTENVVPGDKFKVSSEVLLRFAPLVAPVMSRMNCYVHYFFVPWRLVWDDWEDFITGGADGLSDPAFPNYGFSKTQLPVGSLGDYLGYNFSSDFIAGAQPDFSLLPFRAYQFIYNEYYRDQNLTNPVQFSKSSKGSSQEEFIEGTDYNNWLDALTALTTLRSRAWEKDYFTSALPWVQRGVASQLPISIDTSNLEFSIPANNNIFRTAGTPLNYAVADGYDTQTWPDATDIEVIGNGNIRTKDEGDRLNITTDISILQDTERYRAHKHFANKSDVLNGIKIVENNQGVTIIPPTINELRLAEHIQQWLEKNARGGARYIEQILSHFGVRVPDYRLDRPCYLGGGKSPVAVSEVLQTSSTDATSPQGNMAGHGVSLGNQNKFNYTFPEHGYVIGIMSVLPHTQYQDGISRHLTKSDKFDFYYPEFAHLGEQDIYYYEVYNDGSVKSKTTFGYQERYAEYKYRSGEVHGDFKTSLDSWHTGRKFSSMPDLNTSFVTSDPTNRIFAVPSGVQHMWCQIYNNVRAIRPMPKHSIPSL